MFTTSFQENGAHYIATEVVSRSLMTTEEGFYSLLQGGDTYTKPWMNLKRFYSTVMCR